MVYSVSFGRTRQWRVPHNTPRDPSLRAHEIAKATKVFSIPYIGQMTSSFSQNQSFLDRTIQLEYATRK